MEISVKFCIGDKVLLKEIGWRGIVESIKVYRDGLIGYEVSYWVNSEKKYCCVMGIEIE